jgi:hypothetical protein
MNHTYDPVLVLSNILRRSAAQAETPHGFVALVNPGQETATIEFGIGLGENYVGRTIHGYEGVTGYVLATQTPCVVPHYREWDNQFRGILSKNQAQIGTVAGTPILSEGKVVAILLFIFESPTLCPERNIVEWLQQVSRNAGSILVNMDKVGDSQEPMTPFSTPTIPLSPPL